MVFPEFALLVGAFGGLRCPDRFARRKYGQVFVGESELASFDIVVLDLTLRAKRKRSASWSLKIRELGKRNCGFRVACGSAVCRET